MAVSKTEMGMDYVQVMPDDPRVGLVEPFHGMGYGQMLSNGSFDFVRRKRNRRKPDFKEDYLSLSFGSDGNDRVFFVVPSEMRQDLPQILRKGINKACKFLKDNKYSL